MQQLKTAILWNMIFNHSMRNGCKDLRVYREREYPASLMLPALLTVFKKRNYPPYEHTRDGNIWTSRDDIPEYEKALEAENVLEQIMDTPVDARRQRKKKSNTNSRIREG